MRRFILMALPAAVMLCAQSVQADPFTVVLASVHAGSGDTTWLASVPDSDITFGRALIVIERHKSEVSDAIITLTGSGPASAVFDSGSSSWHSAGASDFLAGLTSGAVFSHGHGHGGALSNGASLDDSDGNGKGGGKG